MIDSNRIVQGDALEVLKTFPSDCVQCVVTSPPYYGLRDYQVDGQIGLESTPVDYVQKLVEVFREVRRVLRPDGTLWLNLGDSYTSHNAKQVKPSGRTVGHVGMTKGTPVRPPIVPHLGAKQLLGIPWRVAIALQDDGWYLRSDIIWSKPNPMPESVTDRPTKSHEYVFLLSKNERYFYDADSIREPHSLEVRLNGRSPNFAPHQWIPDGDKFGNHNRSGGDGVGYHPQGRNKRSVWSIATHPYSEAHFATMPTKLVEPCILAGSRPGDIVLDPFCGAGTVPLVALQYHRRYLGVELNPEYISLIEKRIAVVQPTLWSLEDAS
jgi:DNA modification methylase